MADSNIQGQLKKGTEKIIAEQIEKQKNEAKQVREGQARLQKIRTDAANQFAKRQMKKARLMATGNQNLRRVSADQQKKRRPQSNNLGNWVMEEQPPENKETPSQFQQPAIPQKPELTQNVSPETEDNESAEEGGKEGTEEAEEGAEAMEGGEPAEGKEGAEEEEKKGVEAMEDGEPKEGKEGAEEKKSGKTEKNKQQQADAKKQQAAMLAIGVATGGAGLAAGAGAAGAGAAGAGAGAAGAGAGAAGAGAGAGTGGAGAGVAEQPFKVTPENEGATKRELATGKRASAEAEDSAEDSSDADGTGTQGVNMSGKILTGKILNYCWADVASFFVSTFGASLLYLNFHLIMKYVAYVKSFCHFGAELTPKGATGAAMSQDEENTIPTVGWFEFIALGTLDILIPTLIIAVIYAAYTGLSWQVKGALWVGEKTGATDTIIELGSKLFN